MHSAEWVRPARPDDAEAVRALLESEALPAEFIATEFVVAEAEGRLIGCARARPLPEGGTELASVAVAPAYRGRGLARSLVMTALLGARHPVYALTLVPELAAHGGFDRIQRDDLPPSLQPKAAACDCGDGSWVPMRLRRVVLLSPPPSGDGSPT